MIRTRHIGHFWKLMAIAVIAGLFVVQAMAANAELHRHFHCDSHEPGHECVVTMMQHGGYDEVLPDVLPVDYISEPPQELADLPIAIETEPSHLVGGVLAHAPPRGP